MADIKTIKKPRITEKVSLLAEQNAYTFEVTTSATKNEIKKEIEKLYKVKPIKVNVIRVPRKKIVVRGKIGIRGGGKKAIVYLKKGDKIEIV